MDQAFSLAKSLTTELEQLEASFYRAVRATLVKQLIALIDDEHTLDGKRPRISLDELNARIAAIVAQGVKSDGVVNLLVKRQWNFLYLMNHF